MWCRSRSPRPPAERRRNRRAPCSGPRPSRPRHSRLRYRFDPAAPVVPPRPAPPTMPAVPAAPPVPAAPTPAVPDAPPRPPPPPVPALPDAPPRPPPPPAPALPDAPPPPTPDAVVPPRPPALPPTAPVPEAPPPPVPADPVVPAAFPAAPAASRHSPRRRRYHSILPPRRHQSCRRDRRSQRFQPLRSGRRPNSNPCPHRPRTRTPTRPPDSAKSFSCRARASNKGSRPEPTCATTNDRVRQRSGAKRSQFFGNHRAIIMSGIVCGARFLARRACVERAPEDRTMSKRIAHRAPRTRVGARRTAASVDRRRVDACPRALRRRQHARARRARNGPLCAWCRRSPRCPTTATPPPS